MGAEHSGRAVLARGGPRARGRQLSPLGALPRAGPHEGHSLTLPGQHTAQARVPSCHFVKIFFIYTFKKPCPLMGKLATLCACSRPQGRHAKRRPRGGQHGPRD